MATAPNSMLSKHAVRIRRNNEPIGSGFLIVPRCGSYAYILTAAHVLFDTDDHIDVQLMGIQNRNDQTRAVAEDSIYFHNGYDHSQTEQTVQYGDAALIRLEKEPWMDGVSQIYWGVPSEGMPIQAVGFTSVSTDPELVHSSVSHQTEVRAYTPDSHRISATLRGDFIPKYADLDNDMQGMSGTVFAAQGQDAVVIVGMMIATTGQNAVLGQMNLVDATGIRELLEAQGVYLEKRQIRDAHSQVYNGMAVAVPPQQTHAEEALIRAFITSCQNLQCDYSYRDSNEDIRNARICDDLRLMRYNIRFQSPMGTSISGKRIGEVDIDIRDSFDNPWTICVAMRYRSSSNQHWKSHLMRLLDNYNPYNLPFLVFLNYVEVKREQFDRVCSRLRDHIRCCDPKPFDYVEGSLEKFAPIGLPDCPSIQVMKCRYHNGDYSPTVYHILIHFERDEYRKY